MSEEETWQLGKVGVSVVAFVLWATTAVLGLVEIVVVREMVQRVFARFFADDLAFGGDYWGSVALGQFTVIFLAIVWLGLVVGGGEYHMKHLGKPKSWRLFARTVAVQLSILVLALFI
jgi:hypothetical protein